ncbi:small proline-rich protein 3-like [Psammomys obesus]|uniref:small proline-rich protein 3-like n=1 Tax=Psammomys obesus TaxID=48139 RepID=UPI0024530A94|nr:small proline-rich protein 3-like [Psammomys obesus]
MLQTSSKAPKPTTKSSKADKPRASFLKNQDTVKNPSKQSPRKCYRLELCSLETREPQTHVPIPKATELCFREDPEAILQAYGVENNVCPFLCIPRNAPTASAIKAPCADSLKVPAADAMKVPSADSLKVPSAGSLKVPSADSLKVPSAGSLKVPSADSPKRASAGATKPRVKIQPNSKKKQAKEKHCFSINLVLVNTNQPTPSIQHISVPEATEVTVPEIPFTR